MSTTESIESETRKRESIDDRSDDSMRKRARYIKSVLDSMTEEELTRFEFFTRSHLSRQKVREVMTDFFASQNSTINISEEMVIVVSGLAKQFIGELTDTASDIRKEERQFDRLQVHHIKEAYRWLQLEGKTGQALPEHSYLFQDVSGVSAIRKVGTGSIGGWGTEDDMLDIWSDCCLVTPEKDKEEEEEERQQPTTIDTVTNDTSNDDNYVNNAAIPTGEEHVADASIESMEIDQAEESKVEEEQQQEEKNEQEEKDEQEEEEQKEEARQEEEEEEEQQEARQEEEGPKEEEEPGNGDAWLDSV
eukprot:scaffold4174_cov182-Ochromonas_danica.AAC.3